MSQQHKHGQVCTVKGCSNKTYNCRKSFFRFPNDIKRARLWIVKCNREDLLENIDKLHTSHRLCSDHFEPVMFTNHFRNRLNPKAFPSIFPTLEGASRGDHNYCRLPLIYSEIEIPENRAISTDYHLSASKINSVAEESSAEASSKEITLGDIFKFLDDRYPQQPTASIKSQLTLMDETNKETRPDTSSSPKPPKLDEQSHEAQFVVSDQADFQIKIEKHDLQYEENIIEAEAALSTTRTSTSTANDEIKTEDHTDDEVGEAEPSPSESDERHPIQAFFDSMASTVMQFPPPLAVRAKVNVLQVISKLELGRVSRGPSTATASTYFDQPYCTQKLI